MLTILKEPTNIISFCSQVCQLMAIAAALGNSGDKKVSALKGKPDPC